MTGPRAQMMNEAATWVARMDGGAWDRDSEAELQSWLDADPRHRGALLRAQAAWMTLNQSRRATRTAKVQKLPLLHRRSLLAGAAALAASVAGGLIWFSGGERYATEVGEIRRVPLSDGSVAAINTASTLVVDFTVRGRDVKLEHGEAWFEVARNPARPFLVSAGPVRVRAVGTAFSVRRREGGADVLVTEGVVEAWTDGARDKAIRLAAGERAFLAGNASIKREAAPPSAVDRALAWRDGKIDLVGEPLGEAVAEINRYNRRRIRITDPSIAEERFDGVFRTDDPEGFALAVKQSLGVPVDVSDPSEIRIGASAS